MVTQRKTGSKGGNSEALFKKFFLFDKVSN